MTPHLQVTGLSCGYGKRRVLEDISLSLTHQRTALVGINGAGKTTFLNTIAGARAPHHGSVCVDGVSLYGRERAAVLDRIALMPQGLHLPSRATVEEVVTFYAYLRGVPQAHRTQAATDAIANTQLTSERNTQCRKLSGGMRRRVALAQALVGSPDLLALDEPSTGLDPQQIRLMVTLLLCLPGRLLISSHVMEDVVDLCGGVVVLHNGHIAFHGSLMEFCEGKPVSAAAAEEKFLELVGDR